jgi:hypothetical protein
MSRCVTVQLSRIFYFCGTMFAKIKAASQFSPEVLTKMQRFLSKILLFLLTIQGLSYCHIAAQNIQQVQNSGTGAAAMEKAAFPPAPTQDKANQIPDGTPIEIESPYTLSSMDFKPKDQISFRVVNPIIVKGVTLIEQGAIATGRIEKAKRGGHFGKAGLLVWTMQTVTAVDGSQIPLRISQVRLRGDSKSAKVATAMIITGALLPLIAPVALLHGFKRGENAYIPAGKRYSVYVEGNPTLRTPVTTREQ